MRKTLTRLALAALAASLYALTASAQPTAWVDVAPAGEGFVARMPKPPAPVAQQVKAGGLSVSGRRYAAEGEGGTSFVVWSLNDSGDAGRRLSADNYKDWHLNPEAEAYLDQVAELAWELLVRPEVERLTRERPEDAKKAHTALAWRYEFDTEGDRPARAYFLTLGERRGPVYVCVNGPRIYIAAALASDAQFRQLEPFAESFGLEEGGDAYLPSPSFLRDDRARSFYINGIPVTGAATAAVAEEPRVAILGGVRFIVGAAGAEPGAAAAKVQPAEGATADHGKPFKRSEVTKEARVTHKPEPGYADSARKFDVTGTVFLRAVLAATGEVKEVAVVSRLPHGLTERAVAAARAVKFEPAQKDGRAVSQYAILEYDFDN